MRGADAWAAVLDRLVADAKLGQVVARHLGLDLDLVEGLAVVHADDRADHLGHDEHVAQVRAHGVGLLARRRLLLRLAQLLDERERLMCFVGVGVTGNGVSIRTVVQLPAWRRAFAFYFCCSRVVGARALSGRWAPQRERRPPLRPTPRQSSTPPSRGLQQLASSS